MFPDEMTRKRIFERDNFLAKYHIKIPVLSILPWLVSFKFQDQGQQHLAVSFTNKVGHAKTF